MGNHRGVGLKSEIDFFGVQSLDLGPNLQVFEDFRVYGSIFGCLRALEKNHFQGFFISLILTLLFRGPPGALL